MLFGGCGCLPVAGFFADAAGLCAGGAGFISAMVAAMAHRRQEAEVLMPKSQARVMLNILGGPVPVTMPLAELEKVA